MIAENEYISLKGMSREQRDALRESFLRAYARNGKVAENARAFSIRLCTAQGWVNRYIRDGRKFKKEHVSGRKIGMCRTLTPDEEKRLVNILVDKTPEQYKFKFALWNGRAIRELIRLEFGKEMPARTVRLYMQRLGFTPQRPEKRAREQKPEKVDRWMNRNYPRIAKAVKSMGYEIFWGDETGISTRSNYMRGYAPKGKTPIVNVTSVVSCRINMISAVSNRGTLMFRLYRGGLSILKYLRFIRDLQRDAGHPIVLIVDNLRIHHARIVKAWLRKRRNLIRVFYLPAYSPELNPDELVNSDLKIAIGQREPAQDRDELQAQMQEHMAANQRNPEKMRRLFHKESVKYASHMEN